MKKQGQSDWITTAQAASLIGVSVRRVQAAITAGRLTAQKMGRDWLVARVSAEEYSKSERKSGNPNWQKKDDKSVRPKRE